MNRRARIELIAHKIALKLRKEGYSVTILEGEGITLFCPEKIEETHIAKSVCEIAKELNMKIRYNPERETWRINNVKITYTHIADKLTFILLE